MYNAIPHDAPALRGGKDLTWILNKGSAPEVLAL